MATENSWIIKDSLQSPLRATTKKIILLEHVTVNKEKIEHSTERSMNILFTRNLDNA